MTETYMWSERALVRVDDRVGIARSLTSVTCIESITTHVSRSTHWIGTADLSEYYDPSLDHVTRRRRVAFRKLDYLSIELEFIVIYLFASVTPGSVGRVVR